MTDADVMALAQAEREAGVSTSCRRGGSWR
jgi:hypothetical protein